MGGVALVGGDGECDAEKQEEEVVVRGVVACGERGWCAGFALRETTRTRKRVRSRPPCGGRRSGHGEKGFFQPTVDREVLLRGGLNAGTARNEIRYLIWLLLACWCR